MCRAGCAEWKRVQIEPAIARYKLKEPSHLLRTGAELQAQQRDLVQQREGLELIRESISADFYICIAFRKSRSEKLKDRFLCGMCRRDDPHCQQVVRGPGVELQVLADALNHHMPAQGVAQVRQ